MAHSSPVRAGTQSNSEPATMAYTASTPGANSILLGARSYMEQEDWKPLNQPVSPFTTNDPRSTHNLERWDIAC